MSFYFEEPVSPSFSEFIWRGWGRDSPILQAKYKYLNLDSKFYSGGEVLCAVLVWQFIKTANM